MPNRIIREGINDSDRMDGLVRDAGWGADSFYRRLLNVADDFGRFDARLTVIKAKCYPTLLDMVRDNDLHRWLAACEKATLVRIYTADSKTVGEIIDFRQVKRAEKSRFPSDDATQLHIDCGADAEHVPINCEAPAIPLSESKAQSNAQSNAFKKYRAVDVPMPEIPEPIRTPEFQEAWNDWTEHRRQIKKKLTPLAVQKQFKQFVEMGVTRAVAAIEHTITKGWQGIQEPQGSGQYREETPAEFGRRVASYGKGENGREART
jgi:hypothetical protein